jgi:hypothetical protein
VVSEKKTSNNQWSIPIFAQIISGIIPFKHFDISGSSTCFAFVAISDFAGCSYCFNQMGCSVDYFRKSIKKAKRKKIITNFACS